MKDVLRWTSEGGIPVDCQVSASGLFEPKRAVLVVGKRLEAFQQRLREAIALRNRQLQGFDFQVQTYAGDHARAAKPVVGCSGMFGFCAT